MAEQHTNTRTEAGGGAAGTGAAGSTTGDSGGSKSGGNLRNKVASTVASAADSQKNRAADSIGGIADVARQTGEELRGQNEMLASWVNAASDQLRTLADHLRDRPAAEIADDLSRFARERPALFLGGAFLMGMGVARLLKSSPDQGWHGDADRSGVRRAGEYAETGRGGATGDLAGGAWPPSSSGAF